MLILALILGVQVCQAWKVAVISDMHLNVKYRPDLSEKTFCEDNNGQAESAEMYAPYGRIGCDPPPLLLEKLLQRLNQTDGQIDILFLPGDFIGHSIPIEQDQPFDITKYQQLQDVHTKISDLLAKYLPNTLMIPTFGNNDWLYHY